MMVSVWFAASLFVFRLAQALGIDVFKTDHAIFFYCGFTSGLEVKKSEALARKLVHTTEVFMEEVRGASLQHQGIYVHRQHMHRFTHINITGCRQQAKSYISSQG